eukprot:XP_001693431.1 predicted protein [Chlamydomonas reinhardtii]
MAGLSPLPDASVAGTEGSSSRPVVSFVESSAAASTADLLALLGALSGSALARAVAAGGFMAWASSFRAEADAAARDLEAAHASSHQHPPPHLSPHAKRARGDANRDAAGHILAPASQQLQQQSANAHSNAAAAINNTGDPQCLQATGYNNGVSVGSCRSGPPSASVATSAAPAAAAASGGLLQHLMRQLRSTARDLHESQEEQPGVAGGSGGHLSDNVSGGRVSGIAGVGNALDLLANLATVKLEVLQQQECQGQAVGPVLDAPPALLQQQRRQRSPRPPPHSAPPRQLSQPHHQPPAAAPWSDSSPVVARLAALVEEAEAMASLQQSEPPPQPHRYELQGQQLEHRALQRLRVPRRQWSFPLAAQGPAPPPPGSKDVVAATSANTIYPSTPLPDEASSEDSYPSEWSAGPLPPHAVVERREAPRDEVLSSMEQLRRSRERRKAQLAEANTAAKQRHAAGSDFVRAAAVAALIDPALSRLLPAGGDEGEAAVGLGASATAGAVEPWGAPRTRTTPGYAQQPCAHPGSAADAAAADELGWRAHAGVEKDPLIGPPPNKRARGGQEW